MNKYYGTYLNGFNITITSELFNNGSFLRFPKLNVFGITRAGLKKDQIDSDDVQIFITPYSFNQLKNIYWFEVALKNVKGETSKYLEMFENYKFNILDGRGVDSAEELAEESMGIVELIGEYNGDDNIEDVLKKEYGNRIRTKRAFKNQLIIGDIDHEYRANFSLTPQQLEEQRKEENNGIFYIINLNDFKDDFKNIIRNLDGCYLSITSFSEGNFIAIKFKNMQEEIVPLRIIYKFNQDGTFRKLIKELGSIGVNLKLITPVNLGIDTENKPVYDILFDIANTKLSRLPFASITKLIKSLVSDIEEILPIPLCNDSRKNILEFDDRNNIQKESYNRFKDSVLKLLTESEGKLKVCISRGECSLNKKNCLLATKEQRSLFKNLLEKSENLINDKVLDPYNLKIIVLKTIIGELKKNLSEHKFTSISIDCNCKKGLKVFYDEMAAYLEIRTKFKLPPPK